MKRSPIQKILLRTLQNNKQLLMEGKMHLLLNLVQQALCFGRPILEGMPMILLQI